MTIWTNFSRRLEALLLAVILSATCAAAQETVSADTVVPPPRMSAGGHTFSPSYFLPDPFVNTYFRNSLGFGMTPNLTIPLIEIGGTQYSWNSGQLLFALMRFEFRGALRNWMALNVQLDIIGRLATETIPLVSQGVVLISGYELGAQFEVYRSTDMTLALSAGATSSGMTDVNIRRFITAITDSGNITPDDGLVTSTPFVQAFTDVRLAYGFNDLLGIMAEARLLYGEGSNRSTSDQWYSKFGILLDINPSHRWGTPVGFGVGIKTENNPGGGDESGDRITSYFGRVGYTGSRDFDFGLDVAYSLIPVRSLPERHAFISAIIDMRLKF